MENCFTEKVSSLQSALQSSSAADLLVWLPNFDSFLHHLPTVSVPSTSLAFTLRVAWVDAASLSFACCRHCTLGV